VTESCPADEVLLSGGFTIVSAPDGNREPPFVMASYPASATEWTVEIQHGSTTRRNWTVTVYVLCAEV